MNTGTGIVSMALFGESLAGLSAMSFAGRGSNLALWRRQVPHGSAVPSPLV